MLSQSKNPSPFSPWTGADAAPADAPSGNPAAPGNDALERAAAELSQAAALLLDLARQDGPAGIAGAGGPLALEITVNDAYGDAAPFTASGPDLSLLS